MMQRFILLIAICLAAVSADNTHSSTKITSAHHTHQQHQRRELSSFSFTNIWSNFLNHICAPHDNDKCHGIIHNPCCHVHHHHKSSSHSSSGGGSSSSSSSSSGGSSGGGSDDWSGKSALVSLYHMISCVRYEDSAIWMLHLNLVCFYLIDFATHMY